MSDLFWRCKDCKRYIPDGHSHECIPKPKRRELKAKISQLEAKLKEHREMFKAQADDILIRDNAIAELKKTNSQLASAWIKREPEDKENNFSQQAADAFVCGFCGSHHNRVGGIKAHIRDNH